MDYKDILKSDYFNETYSQIEELKKDFYVNHGFIHVNGVIKNAEYLADLFCLSQKQKDLLLIASALHDIGYLKGREEHPINGATLAKEYLDTLNVLSDKEVERITKAISSHGGKTEDDYTDDIS